MILYPFSITKMNKSRLPFSTDFCNYVLQQQYIQKLSSWNFLKYTTLIIVFHLSLFFNVIPFSSFIPQFRSKDPNILCCLTAKQKTFKFNCSNKAIFFYYLSLCVLRSGGYNFTSTARLWTYLTSLTLGLHLNDDIPDHQVGYMCIHLCYIHKTGNNRPLCVVFPGLCPRVRPSPLA